VFHKTGLDSSLCVMQKTLISQEAEKRSFKVLLSGNAEITGTKWLQKKHPITSAMALG